MTTDHFPRLHELAPGLFAGLGYNGRGIAAGTMMGRDLAALVRAHAMTRRCFRSRRYGRCAGTGSPRFWCADWCRSTACATWWMSIAWRVMTGGSIAGGLNT